MCLWTVSDDLVSSLVFVLYSVPFNMEVMKAHIRYLEIARKIQRIMERERILGSNLLILSAVVKGMGLTGHPSELEQM